MSRLSQQTRAVHRAGWLIAALLAGCNQLYGLDETVPYEDRGTVTGVYKLRWAENEASGAPVVREGAYSVDELTADVELDDGTRRDVALASDGTFSFTTASAGQAYALTFQTTYSRITYQLSAQDLVLVDRVAARRDRELVPRNTELIYQLTNRPAMTLTSREEIMTTGVWTRRQIIANQPIRYDWATAERQSIPLGLLDASKFDDAYYVFFDRVPTNYRIMASAKARGSLVGGQANTLSAGAATTLTDSRCAHVEVQSQQEAARISALFPDAASTLAFWILNATPSQEFAQVAALPVAFGLSNAAGADVATDVDYGSPIPGGVIALDFALGVSRPGMAGVSVQTSVPLAGDCPTTTRFIAGEVSLPTTVSVAGTAITDQDQFVTIDRSRPVPVMWESSAGRVDAAGVTLIEVVDDNTTIARSTYLTTGTSVLIPVAELDRGRRYSLLVRLTAGVPGAAIGHFDRLDETVSTGTFLSTSFTVAN